MYSEADELDMELENTGAASLGDGGLLTDDILPSLPAWVARISYRIPFVHTVPVRRKGMLGVSKGVYWQRTAKRWAHQGGMGLQIYPKSTYRSAGKMVVLWDVSGSMSDSIDLYAAWLYGLVQRHRQLGVFPFGTDVDDVTEAMRAPFPFVRARLRNYERLWIGGTNMGCVLSTWMARFQNGWLGSNTTMVIISDGWDVGSPEDVKRVLHELRSRGIRLIWINPLMGTPGFEPRTRTLLAALPYLDGMYSGHTVEALLSLS